MSPETVSRHAWSLKRIDEPGVVWTIVAPSPRSTLSAAHDRMPVCVRFSTDEMVLNPARKHHCGGGDELYPATVDVCGL